MKNSNEDNFEEKVIKDTDNFWLYDEEESQEVVEYNLSYSTSELRNIL